MRHGWQRMLTILKSFGWRNVQLVFPYSELRYVSGLLFSTRRALCAPWMDSFCSTQARTTIISRYENFFSTRLRRLCVIAGNDVCLLSFVLDVRVKFVKKNCNRISLWNVNMINDRKWIRVIFRKFLIYFENIANVRAIRYVS